MRILLAGPLETRSLGVATGIDLSGLPAATTQTPLSPLAGGLIRAGHQVHILTMDPLLSEPETHVRGPLTITFCPLRGEPRYRARTRSRDLFAVEIAHLTAVMRASDADIVHANWTYEYAEAAIRSRRPMVATMHDLGWDYLLVFRDLYRSMRLLMKYRAMVRLPALTAVAPFMARKAWHYGYFGKVDVVPNPIEVVPYPPKSPDRPIIATIGNSGPVKNVAASVAAFAQIRAALPAAELHLFGPGLGPDGPFGRAGPGIVCHGNIPHQALMDFFANEARLLVHPALIETFGVVVAEAKVRGIPVIAGNRSGGVEYAVGNSGTLVDVRRPAAIARAAIDLLTDVARYPDRQRAGHDDVAARFAVDTVTAQYIAVYERILRAARPR